MDMKWVRSDGENVMDETKNKQTESVISLWGNNAFYFFLRSVSKCLIFTYRVLFSRVSLKAWILESDCFPNPRHITGRTELCKLKIDLTSQSLSFLVCEIVILIVSAIQCC